MIEDGWLRSLKREEKRLKTKIIISLALFGSLMFAANDVPKRLSEATTVITEVMGTPDKGIPQDLLNKAACVAVVPGVKKGAFIVGAKYGRGFVSCRNANGIGWSAPSGVRVEGGSFGFQIGGSETDVVMLIMNKSGQEKLLKSKFTLGGDASVAAGPVGRTTSAETDALMRAEILSWSRSRGVFAGIALNGATLRPDDDTDAALYGSGATPKSILFGNTKVPASARRLIHQLNKYSSRQTS
jgi:lipid-binding SYLF domain-containing protein